MEDMQKFLGLAQGKGGDQNTASGRKDSGGLPGKGIKLPLPILGMIFRIIPIGTLQDQRVDLQLRNDRSRDQGLSLKGYIARIVKLALALPDEYSRRSQNVPRRNKPGLNPSPEVNALAQDLAGRRPSPEFQPHDFSLQRPQVFVLKEGVVQDPLFFPEMFMTVTVLWSILRAIFLVGMVAKMGAWGCL